MYLSGLIVSCKVDMSRFLSFLVRKFLKGINKKSPQKILFKDFYLKFIL